jgi:hypothetical protein
VIDPERQKRGCNAAKREGTWEAAIFRAGAGNLFGSVWGRWGVEHRPRRRYVVYLIGAGRLTEFKRLAAARRFCEAIEPLADWSNPTAAASADPTLVLRMHRIALKITGSRPDLHGV